MAVNAFLRYWENNRFEKEAGELDIARRDPDFQVYRGSVALLTPMGKEFIHASERVARLIITDLICESKDKNKALLAPWLYAFQKDVFETSGDPFPDQWEELLVSDPFVTVKTTGKFPFRPYTPDDELFSFSIMTLTSLVSGINEFIHSTMREIILDETEAHPFPELLRSCYDQLTREKKVAVQALSGLHHSGIVLPLVLVSGVISPMEYAKGLVALRIREEAQDREVLPDLLHVMDYLQCLEKRTDNVVDLAQVIREGENDMVEFKSTFRWDLRAGKTNPAVERASLKTIAAFLNSGGGTLLVGVRDDGSIEGIESDKFVNDDKFLLHLWTLIRTSLGRDVSPYLRTTIEKTEDRSVCVVRCLQCNRPVFLRQPGFDEEFYIRVGPSSNAMDISEALKYIADHFKVQ